jgi:photosystem II stability/assembly factor-like uncharacterized protein
MLRLIIAFVIVFVLRNGQAAAAEPDLTIQELNIFQSLFRPSVTARVTISFQVFNNGGASNTRFRTAISGIGPAINIDTAGGGGRPSIRAGETVYFSKTIVAPARGPFTVTVRTDTQNALVESNESNNEASKTSSIDSPPIDQWYWVGPARAIYGSNNSGRLLEVIFDPFKPKIMYTRGEEASIGIWKTSDGGSTWRNVSLSLPNPTNTALAMAPDNPKRVYALSLSDGLYRSEDGANSWRRIATGAMIAGAVNSPSFAISPSNTNTLFFAGSNGVYRSTDGGYNWTSSSSPYLRRVGANGLAAIPSTTLLDPGNGSTLYAALQHADDAAAGVYRTTTAISGDDSDWRKMGQCDSGALPGLNGAKPWLAFVPTVPATLYVLIEGSPVRLFKSTGTCTSRTGSDLSFKEIRVATSPPLPLFAFTVNPGDATRMFAGAFSGGSSYVWRSTDEGANWSSAPTGHADLKSFAWNTKTIPATIYAASDGGLHRSGDNGDNWKLVSGGVENIEFYHIAMDSSSNLFGGTQDNGNLQWDRSSLDWKYIGGGDGGRVAAAAAPFDIQYITDQYPNSLTKRNQGANSTFSQGLPADTSCPQPDIHVPQVPDSSSSPQVYVACKSLYWRSDNGSATAFTAIFTPPTGKGAVFRSLYDFHTQRFFIGTTTGEVYATSGTPDGSSRWTNIFSAGAAITDLGFGSGTGRGILFVATNRSTGAGRIYRLKTTSDKSGNILLESQRDITFNLTSNRTLNALANHTGDTVETVYAGTSDGVYRGTLNADGRTYSWASMRNGMGHNVNVTGLIVYYPPGLDLFLAASTYGRSAFVTRIPRP